MYLNKASIFQGVVDVSIPPILAEQGSIKEEFDEMFHKLRIEEERSRQLEQIASEELARKLMVNLFNICHIIFGILLTYNKY